MKKSLKTYSQDLLAGIRKKISNRKASDHLLLAYCLIFMLPGFIMNSILPDAKVDFNKIAIYFIVVALFYNFLRILPRSLGIVILLLNLYYNFTNIIHYLQYESRLKTGSLIGIFFTDSSEASEFFYILPIQYFIIIALYAVLGLIVTLSLILLSKNNRRLPAKYYLVVMLALASLNIFMQQYDRFSFFHYSFVHLKHFYWEYQIARSYAVRKELYDKHKSQESRALSAHNGQIHLLVLGESLGRSHMSIYGYQRNTTPKLTERLPELILFDNTIAPANMTQLSLPLALSRASASDTSILLDSLSLISEMKLRGYKSFWISNQQEPLSENTPLNLILDDADQVIHVWKNQPDKKNTYDADILDVLDQILQKNAQSNRPLFIIIHMKGSHARYEKRIPHNKIIFKPTMQPTDRYQYSNRSKIINSYDNTVRYLDYFLNEIFSRLEQQSKPSTLFFFSDHGEMLLARDNSRILHGYSEPYKDEYHIPFFYWHNNVADSCLRPIPSDKQKKFINMSNFFSIFLYAVCLDDYLPDLHDDTVLALGRPLSYDSLP